MKRLILCVLALLTYTHLFDFLFQNASSALLNMMLNHCNLLYHFSSVFC